MKNCFHFSNFTVNTKIEQILLENVMPWIIWKNFLNSSNITRITWRKNLMLEGLTCLTSVLIINLCPQLCASVTLTSINFPTEIYPSSFTNGRFWTKIEFSNVVKCQRRSQGDVSSAIDSWQSTGEDRGGGAGGYRPLKVFAFVDFEDK